MSEGYEPETDAEAALDLLAQHPNPPPAGVASGWVAEQLHISRVRAINALNELQAAGKATLDNGGWKHPDWPAAPAAPKAARIPRQPTTPPATTAEILVRKAPPPPTAPEPEITTPPPAPRIPAPEPPPPRTPPRAGLFSEQAIIELERAMVVLEARIKQDTEAVASIKRLLA